MKNTVDGICIVKAIAKHMAIYFPEYGLWLTSLPNPSCHGREALLQGFFPWDRE